MNAIQLCCPYCHWKIDRILVEQHMLHCPECGRTYQNREGVIDFIPADDFYWGELNREEMMEINKRAERDGWFAAVLAGLENRKSLVAYLLDSVRPAGLFHCYDPTANEACLDIGSGWGPLSFGLSRFFETVYSVDGVLERLRFQVIRAQQEGIANIRFLRSRLLQLPIPDQSVNLVVINGVLEWIGLSDSKEDPETLQGCFLREVLRVLRPGGTVLIGIENRFGLQYFLGAKDHGGLSFTSLVPRQVANLLVWLKRGPRNGVHVFSGAESEYRTYTYSAWGYQRLLQGVGFDPPSIYWVWPTYSYPRMTGPLDGRSVRHVARTLGNMIDNRWFRCVVLLGARLPSWLLRMLVRCFFPSFLIVASRNRNKNTCVEDVALGGDPQASTFVRLSLGTRQSLQTTFLLLRDNVVSKVIRVAEKTVEGSSSRFTFDEKAGVSGRSFKPHSRRDLILSAEWLAQYHHDHRSATWDRGELENEIRVLCESASRIPGCQDLVEPLARYESAYLQQVVFRDLPIVPEHGDFTPPNLLVGPEQTLIVIDWEYHQDHGNPMMDVGAMSLSLWRRSTGKSAPSFFARPASPLSWFTTTYRANIDIPASLSPVYYLLRVLARRQSQHTVAPMEYAALANWASILPSVLKWTLRT